MLEESRPNFLPATSVVQLGRPTERADGSAAIESRYAWTIAVTALSTSSVWRVRLSRLASSFGGSGSGRTQRRPSASSGPIRPINAGRRGAGALLPVSGAGGRGAGVWWTTLGRGD